MRSCSLTFELSSRHRRGGLPVAVRSSEGLGVNAPRVHTYFDCRVRNHPNTLLTRLNLFPLRHQEFSNNRRCRYYPFDIALFHTELFRCYLA
jgi:hypothetical protein